MGISASVIRFGIDVLRDRTVRTLLVLLAATLVLVMWQLSRLSERIIEVAAVEGTKLYAGALEDFRELYAHEVVERLAPLGIEAVDDYGQWPNTIPLPATLTIMFGQHLTDEANNLLVRLYSQYPFPSRRNGGPQDEFEKEALARLAAQPDQPVIHFQSLSGAPVIRFAKADRMRAACVSCHNTHPLSPKKDWKVGDVRGVLEVTRPLTKAVAEGRSGLQETFVILLALGGSGTVGVGIVIGRLRRTARELEGRVQARTAELAEAKGALERKIDELEGAERQLHEQARELARSNADLQEFAFVASHDLREPLRMIKGFAQLLSKRYQGKLDKDADEYLGYVIDGGHRMEQLVEGLLEYARIGGRRDIVESVDCEVVLRHVMTNLATAIAESQAKVTHDPLPSVVGMSFQLTQLLQNLIGNALKYHGEAPPRVHIGAQQDSGMWKFTVRDEGIGFSSEAAERIFKLFRRESDDRSGAGIGLAVCKKIVESHGGRIWAESQLGQGASFYFTLPAGSSTAKP